MEYEISPDKLYLHKFPHLEILLDDFLRTHIAENYLNTLNKCPRLIEKYFCPEYITVRDDPLHDERYHIIPFMCAYVFNHELSATFIPLMRKFANNTSPPEIEIFRLFGNGRICMAYSPNKYVDIALYEFDENKYSEVIESGRTKSRIKLKL